ncbi:MAG: transcriptional regulator, partial [Thalassospira sp.]
MDPNKITETLQSEIENGTLAPGTILKQERLAERFGVSRQPVRQALERLLANGLLTKRSDRSLAVNGLSANEARELSQIRISLESTALILSIPHLTQRDLRKAIRLNDDLFEEEAPAIIEELDIAFHRTLYAPCGNGRLLQMIDEL